MSLATAKRDVVTIDDLSDQDIENIFQLADGYLDTMAPKATPNQTRGKLDLASGFILSTLFAGPPYGTNNYMPYTLATIRGTLSLGGGTRTWSRDDRVKRVDYPIAR